uniref:F-box protein 46 n=1 Tax=Neogobius melanostomus TaxID=47308 RepID=A0A8C6SAE3_9GOBI
MEDGRVLLDTWYVIKPGNTKEKIAFFVAHQFSGAGQARPSAMKVRASTSTAIPGTCTDSPALTQDPAPLSDLLSVAEMVALVEQRTTLALQGITDQELEEQQETCRVAQAIARFESRHRRRPKPEGGDSNADTNSPNASDAKAEHGAAEKKSRERVTGFHVEVVVTGAVDQCVFYGKDGTENSDDPPPGQLFFLHPAGNESARPESPIVTDDHGDSSLCRLYRHVSHDFLEIRFQIQRLLEPRQYMLLLPDHIMVNIFSYLPTRSLAALKCTCHYFKALIETYGVRAVDSRWTQDPLYRDDPCKQCKRQYERGDVSLCRWHPKPYHHDLPYGRSYWMCCRRTDKDTPGCRVGLHDNNWVQSTAEGAGLRARREERREEAR